MRRLGLEIREPGALQAFFPPVLLFLLDPSRPQRVLGAPPFRADRAAPVLSYPCPRPRRRGRRLGGGAGCDGGVLQGAGWGGSRGQGAPHGERVHGMHMCKGTGTVPATHASSFPPCVAPPPLPNLAAAHLPTLKPLPLQPPHPDCMRRHALGPPDHSPPHASQPCPALFSFPSTLTQIVCDGMYSAFRRKLAQPDVHHPSFFIGLLLKVGAVFFCLFFCSRFQWVS